MGVSPGMISNFLALMAEAALGGQPNVAQSGADEMVNSAKEGAQGLLVQEHQEELEKQAKKKKKKGIIGDILGSAATAGTSMIPGVGPFIAPTVGEAVRSQVSGNDFNVAGAVGGTASAAGAKADSLINTGGPDSIFGANDKISPALKAMSKLNNAPAQNAFSQASGVLGYGNDAIDLPSVVTPGLRPDLARQVNQDFYQREVAGRELGLRQAEMGQQAAYQNRSLDLQEQNMKNDISNAALDRSLKVDLADKQIKATKEIEDINFGHQKELIPLESQQRREDSKYNYELGTTDRNADRALDERRVKTGERQVELAGTDAARDDAYRSDMLKLEQSKANIVRIDYNGISLPYDMSTGPDGKPKGFVYQGPAPDVVKDLDRNSRGEIDTFGKHVTELQNDLLQSELAKGEDLSSIDLGNLTQTAVSYASDAKWMQGVYPVGSVGFAENLGVKTDSPDDLGVIVNVGGKKAFQQQDAKGKNIGEPIPQTEWFKDQPQEQVKPEAKPDVTKANDKKLGDLKKGDGGSRPVNPKVDVAPPKLDSKKETGVKDLADELRTVSGKTTQSGLTKELDVLMKENSIEGLRALLAEEQAKVPKAKVVNPYHSAVGTYENLGSMFGGKNLTPEERANKELEAEKEALRKEIAYLRMRRVK